MKKFSILSLLFMTACFNPQKSTVMITTSAGNSGGSGSVINSYDTYSLILTNAHICKAVRNGGIVSNADGDVADVVSYKVSELHDLCMIKVHSNMHAETVISTTIPSTLDPVTVLGHPHLLPIMKMTGNYGDKKVIEVMYGTRECTAAELVDPNTSFFCTLFHKIPLIRAFESSVISALISPGSSGSAVYNNNNEIVGVVFAGGGDPSYGFIVPLEYVYNFVYNELPGLKNNIVDPMILFVNDNSDKPSIADIRTYCSITPNDKVCLRLDDYVDPTALIYHR